ncbi:glycoside hydrolase family 47 protein [Hygrophoropsis aurantiaca]|uniref:Glycoside hydrolase family 47 protein n=1 Tax=Hygrophoropsis aurantiaca TaxID=72124 RepID=A0ACB8ATA0_9AGAM|nr:glycoside hydrolase family 47 protein [Hygrophoropsis aurantiaca]
MKWNGIWPGTLVVLLLVALDSPVWSRDIASPINSRGSAWTTQRKRTFRDSTKRLFYHGFDHYMSHAFPLDELSPLTCTGRGPDWLNPANIATNDVSGNFSLTLVDVLDTLVVMDDPPGFQDAVRNVIDWVSFDVNTKPQVFETTIRVLGGLLSGHIFASKPDQPFYLPWYRDQLLTMAHDLGRRLLPAFATPTGIPYARLNLRHGVLRGESLDTCTAGAGSLILEFATLSRLTGDDRFEKAAYKAFFALWNRKSEIGLVGNSINIWTGAWIAPEVSGIGAGIDSFYEYALKWYIMSGEVEFLDVWHDAYAAVMRYSRSADGYWYRMVNIHTGDQAYNTLDSLSAFWPGLQVLGGDVQNAIKSHMTYWNLWRRHSGLPEVWDVNYMQATSFQYPLRPEFVESTWYLYRATRDPYYLDIGERILKDLTVRAKVDCGLTGIKDLRTNARDDRMESFALSETLKYLFLLFDEDNPLHRDDSNYVFTTEGHILTLPNDTLKPMSSARRKMRRLENHQCPAYESTRTFHFDYPWDGLIQGVGSREDVDYARYLIGLRPQPLDELQWSSYGWCAIPRVDLYSYDFLLTAQPGQPVVEDPKPSVQKLELIPEGFILHNISGIRAHIVSRLDSKGYDITKLGPYAVRSGQIVYVDDRALLNPTGDVSSDDNLSNPPDVQFRFSVETGNPQLQVQQGILDITPEIYVTAYPARFGADPSSNNTYMRFTQGIRVRQDNANPLGCKPYQTDFAGDAILTSRGECSFLEKLVHARAAGASGVVVINDDDSPLNPTASSEEIAAAGDIGDIAMVVLTRSEGESVAAIMNSSTGHADSYVMVTILSDGWLAQTDTQSEIPPVDSSRVLLMNGHPVLNTRLLI